MNANEFGFMVRVSRGKWSVALPHQCDYWDIAGGDASKDGLNVTREEAIDALTKFLAEGANALAALAREDEYP